MAKPYYVGCAGWSIPSPWKSRFPGGGTLLERYGRIFPCVEINTTFYRSHKPETYRRWAESVPRPFRFSVKAPRYITHLRRLQGIEEALARFLAESSNLGEKRGAYLFQFPPSFRFHRERVEAFCRLVRSATEIPVVVEPRHPDWFDDTAETLWETYRITRAAVDPAPVPEAAAPGGWKEVVYYRWHGSPKMYYSAYDDRALQRLAQEIRRSPAEVWCIFDNTGAGAAVANALTLMRFLGISPGLLKAKE